MLSRLSINYRILIISNINKYNLYTIHGGVVGDKSVYGGRFMCLNQFMRFICYNNRCRLMRKQVCCLFFIFYKIYICWICFLTR